MKYMEKSKCNQCKLEGNNGICDRKNCKNYKTEEVEDWEKEFDQYYPELLTEAGEVRQNVKEFIKYLLSSNTERLKKEAIKEILKLSEKVIKETGSFKYDDQYRDCIDIINNINNS